MNEIAISKSAQKHENLVKYLKESKYADIPEVHVNLLIAYCEAANLDPLADAAHLVPFNKNVGDKKNPKWIKTYQIVPGIAKFRIQASRTGRCVGIEEPLYGPMITEKIGTVQLSYPEWCIVTVKMLVKGKVAKFKAKEFWKECYSSSSKSDPTPKDMWLKRPMGQLAKCTEAQAWRKAAPELFGGELTFEEMQGKYSDEQFYDYDKHDYQVQNVADKIKQRLKAKALDNIKPITIDQEIMEETTIEKKEQPLEELLPEPIEQLSEAVKLFNMVRNATPAITARVNEYLEKAGLEIFDSKAKIMLKNIEKAFPEVKRQLSDYDKELLNKICNEDKK